MAIAGRGARVVYDYDGSVYCAVVKWTKKKPMNVYGRALPVPTRRRNCSRKIADFCAEKFDGIEENFLNFFSFFIHVAAFTTVRSGKRVGPPCHDSWRGRVMYAYHFCSNVDFRDLLTFNYGRKPNGIEFHRAGKTFVAEKLWTFNGRLRRGVFLKKSCGRKSRFRTLLCDRSTFTFHLEIACVRTSLGRNHTRDARARRSAAIDTARYFSAHSCFHKRTRAKHIRRGSVGEQL